MRACGGEVKVVWPGFEEAVEEARAEEAERLLEDENGRAAWVVFCLLVPMPCGVWTVCGGLVGTLGPTPLRKHSSSPMLMVSLPSPSAGCLNAMTSVRTFGWTPATGRPCLICFLHVASGWRRHRVTTWTSRSCRPTWTTISADVRVLIASFGSVSRRATTRRREGKERK